MINILDKMSSSNQLYGVPPQVLAAVASNESGYENAGAGVNSSGYGGYFGLGVGQPYPGGGPNQGQAGSATRSLMLTNSPTSFQYQAKLSSAEIAWLDQTYAGGTMVKALEDYVGGPGNPTYAGEAQIYTQTVLGGHGQAGGTPGGTPSGGISGTPSNYPQVTTTQLTAAKAQSLHGATAILTEIDAFLNPGTTKGGFLSFLTLTHDVKALATMLLARGLFSLFFLGVTATGIYFMIKGPAVATAQTGANLYLSRERAVTARMHEVRLGGTNP